MEGEVINRILIGIVIKNRDNKILLGRSEIMKNWGIPQVRSGPNVHEARTIMELIKTFDAPHTVKEIMEITTQITGRGEDTFTRRIYLTAFEDGIGFENYVTTKAYEETGKSLYKLYKFFSEEEMREMDDGNISVMTSLFLEEGKKHPEIWGL